ncbi:hypothetical protein LOK49_LG14G00747 [Camellia lanceoleosa]|uniref:Uncharacterized protein n=1 Tax=Camellia lanceoleosa TaxID=1840588 RepID=A0ACC0FDX6_9ERIC|nr:hypothetical protein LOK49_LG14G00747 [Camellia lanceoleosa]
MNHYGIQNTIVRVSSLNSNVFDWMIVRKILGIPYFAPLPNFPNSVSMKLLIWNCRGADNKVFRRTMKELEKNHKPSIIVLMETKIDLSSMSLFFNKLGFTASSHVDPVGRSGSIWVLWDPFKATVKAHEVNAQVIQDSTG